MSYLNPLRLHFAGRFQVNVSTVNNDAGHYDTGRFKPQYQEMQDGHQMNGWFNPQGDAAWRLLGCRVTGATGAGEGDDTVVGMVFGDADSRVPAKMCDLDPQQQMVSEIWGLQIRIVDDSGAVLLRGEVDAPAFMDIWNRAIGSSGGGDMNAGAVYQSVVRGLQWGDLSKSPVLTALQASAAASGLLSIKFNLDGVNADFTSPDFMCGRITGTVGPQGAAEPAHLVLGRQLVAAAQPGSSGFFTPNNQLNFCVGSVDTARSMLLVDLGNAVPTTVPAGPLVDLGDLTFSANGVTLGVLPSQGTGGYASDPTWYGRTAGVVAFSLNTDQLSALAAAPLTITGNTGVSIAENPSGAFVRADRFVYRMSPGDTAQISLWVTQWGVPLAGAAIQCALDGSLLQSGSMSQPFDCPKPGVVAAGGQAPSFPSALVTDATGCATLTVTANDPGVPRRFKDGSSIDGQVFGIRPTLSDPTLAGPAALENQWNFVSFLIWSAFSAPAQPTWADVEPVLKQYANLYPIMGQFLDLGDESSVNANARLLLMAFALPDSNPNAMPVTRDLSPARRAMLVAYLQSVSSSAVNTKVGRDRRSIGVGRSPAMPSAAAVASPSKGGKWAAMAQMQRNRLTRPAAGRPRLRVRARTAPAGSSALATVCVLLQQAIELEHATLPPYLYALYSLNSALNPQIAQIIQSVAIEEMLHFTLACNVLNALGVNPTIDQPGFIPTYPGPLPGGVEEGLIVHLAPFSMDQLQTFLDIEQPEDPIAFRSLAAADTDGPMTIGQFYHQIMAMIAELGDSAFVPGPRNQIGPDLMDQAVVVTDTQSALRALETIVLQGEGTSTTPEEVVGDDLAHYYRFMQIQKGRALVRVATSGPIEEQYTYSGAPIAFDPTGVYAAPTDPSAAGYPAGSQQAAFNNRFNYTYTALLRCLQAAITGQPAQLVTAIGLMMSIKGQARDMMSGVPNPAVVTGPSFEYLATDPLPG